MVTIFVPLIHYKIFLIKIIYCTDSEEDKGFCVDPAFDAG